MIEPSDIKPILKAFSQVDPKLVLQTFSFETNPLYSLRDMLITKDGWVINNSLKKYHYLGAVNLGNPSTPLSKFYSKFPVYEVVARNVVLIKEQLNRLPLLRDISTYETNKYIYIYSNTPEAINLTGKKYSKFRVAMRYLDDADITVESYHCTRHLTELALADINTLSKAWLKGQEDRGYKFFGSLMGIINNLYKYAEGLNYFVTIIYYKDIPIHFYTSIQTHPNYILVAECKTNLTIPKDIERKYQYIYFTAHTLHIRYWHERCPNEETIYYNMGNSPDVSYKNHLRPAIKSPSLNLKISSIPEDNCKNTLF